MSSRTRRWLTLADGEDTRLALAAVLSALTCLIVLAHVAGWLMPREPLRRTPATIEMRLVEIAPPALLRTPAAPVAPATPSASQRNPIRPQRAVIHSVQARQTQTLQRHDEPHFPTKPVAPARQEEPVTAPTQTAAASTVASASTAIAAATSATSATSGSTQARLLSQAMPVLPDDLREQGYQVTAVAHFKVHADGTFDVELAKPTQNPRLNQILLETLHRWRFFPAMQNGHPVESDQDVRVHFSVS